MRTEFDALSVYRGLVRQYGPQRWWPVYSTQNGERIVRHPCPKRLTEEIRFQICVGAILTQNTAWTNVERAMTGMCRGGFYGVPSHDWDTRHPCPDRQGVSSLCSIPSVLTRNHANASFARRSFVRTVKPCPTGYETWSPVWIASLPYPHLARLIRPAGYFNQKAKKLHIFSRWLLREYDGSLARFFRLPTTDCRQQLLSLWGIGPETADSMLLYAGRHPVFVIDAYTKRFLAQHDITFRTYDEYQRFFMDRLPLDAVLFNEYHALIVAWGKGRRV